MNQFPFSLLFDTLPKLHCNATQYVRSFSSCYSTPQVRAMSQRELINRYQDTGEADIKPILPAEPRPHSVPSNLTYSSIAPTSPGLPNVNTCSKHLVDVKSVIHDRVEKVQHVEVHDGFRLLLLAYSRAIMNLKINHNPDQAQALMDAIISAKTAVIAHHEDSMKDLQMDIRVKDEQIRQLQDALEEQEEAAVARDSGLRRELLEMKMEKERYERAWNESVGMRKEYEVMKEERAREVQRAVRVWETSEKAKLGK
jgi:hypothetical protein